MRIKDWNNGYGCSCCRRDWDNHEWIEESDMESLERIIDILYYREWYDSDFNQLGLRYEKEGSIIYGYEIDYHRATDESYLLLGEERYRFSDKEGGPGLSKEEALKKAQEWSSGKASNCS